MMKKMMCLLLCVIMLVSLAACGSKPSQEDETVSAPDAAVETSPKAETAAAEESRAQEDEETYVYQVPMEEIYCNYPAKLTYFTQSYTQLLFTGKDALVGLCFSFENYTGSLDEVYNFLMPHFLDDASTSSRCTLFGAEYQLNSSESVTVNGLDSCKFDVTVTCEEGWDCHVYGYSFVFDGIAYAVIGLVSTEEQASDMIEEYDGLVDQIAATVRTTP